MHNLVQGENVMICCLENIPWKRQASFFKPNESSEEMILSHLGSLLSWASRVLLTDQRSSSSLSPAGSSVLSHEKQAPSSCPLIELTPLRCSVYMPASLSQRTIEIRGVAIVYPQVSLAMLHQPILLTLLLTHLVMLIRPFHSDLGTYLCTLNHHTHALSFKCYLHTDDSSTFLHSRLFSWAPNT